MKNRWLVNIALLLTVAVLAAIAFYRPGRQTNETPTPLTDVARTDIRRIEIDRPNVGRIVLERADSAWRLTQPLVARTNEFNVDALLNVAGAAIDAAVPDTGGDLQRFGLDPPALTLKLNDASIAFGGMHPLKPLHYVRYRDHVYLISSRYFANAAMPYTNFIDTRLFGDERQPQAFELPGFRVEVSDGIWRRRPEIKTLSSDRINDFVAEWRNARALSVERYGGRAPLDRIRVRFANTQGAAETLTLALLARQPEFVLYRPDEGLEYHFPEETGARLLQLSADGK